MPLGATVPLKCRLPKTVPPWGNGKPLPLGATQNHCPSGQRCPSNVASGKPFPLGETQNRCPSGQRKTVAPRGNGVPRMSPPENRFPSGKRKTVAPRGQRHRCPGPVYVPSEILTQQPNAARETGK